MHVWALGLSCETPAAPPDRAAGAHTTARELQTCTFERPGASNTTKIPRKRPKEREKRKKTVAGEGKKKREILGPHRSGPHSLGPHHDTKNIGQKIGLTKIGLAKIGFGQNWPGQNHDGQKWIGQNWIGQNWSNQDGQNGIGQSQSLPIGLRLAKPGNIGFSKRKKVPGKPDAKSLETNSRSTVHSVYATSSKYPGKQRTIAWKNTSQTSSSVKSLRNEIYRHCRQQ